MSDKLTIVGRCTEISEKSGWTTFSIDAGGQWPVKLSTKLEKLVAAGRGVGQQDAAWTYTEKESDKVNEHTGRPFVNRYLDGVELPGEGGAAPAETPTDAAPKQHTTPLQGGEKDRAITRMACLRSAAQTLQGTHGDLEDLAVGVRVLELAERYERWVYRDIEDIPF
jgi:hypothetical protein